MTPTRPSPRAAEGGADVYPDGATQPGVFVDPGIGRDREPDAAFIVAAVNYVRSQLARAAIPETPETVE